MPNYTVVISAAADPGITAARNAYNNTLQTNEDGSNPAAWIVDNQAYVQKTMEEAANSYCLQYGVVTAPVNTVAPLLDKTTVAGGVGTAPGGRVTCAPGTWTGFAPITYAYQWQRNGVNIRFATTAQYFAMETDKTGSLTCRVTATNAAGYKQAFSSNACTVT